LPLQLYVLENESAEGVETLRPGGTARDGSPFGGASFGGTAADEGPDPIVHLRIDHQMNTGGGAAIDYAMPQTHVDVIAAALFEQQAFAFEEKFHVGARLDGDVDADFAVFIAEAIVAVFAYEGAGREAEEADRFQRTFKNCEDALKIWTDLERGSVDENRRSRRVGTQMAWGPGAGAQCDASPIAAVIALVIVRDPVLGSDLARSAWSSAASNWNGSVSPVKMRCALSDTRLNLSVNLVIASQGFQNIAVLIPAWQPDHQLSELASLLLALEFGVVLIVNDGSDPDHSRIFASLAGVTRVRIIPHAVNLGKGRALKTGFNEFLTCYPGLRGCGTCDADGQHRAEGCEGRRAGSS